MSDLILMKSSDPSKKSELEPFQIVGITQHPRVHPLHSRLDPETRIPYISAAGVLPYAVNRRQVLFLLGKEQYDPGWNDSDTWSDFGGRREAGETVEECASREFFEETAGIVCPQEEMRKRIMAREYCLFSELQLRQGGYRNYLMRIPYKDYPSAFTKSLQFLKYIKADARVVEKSQMGWFSYGILWDAVHNSWCSQKWGKRRPRFRKKFAEGLRKIFESITEETLIQTS